MNKAVILYANGKTEVITYTQENLYQTLRDAVGGYIERVSLTNIAGGDVDVWVNEEGILQDLPLNPAISFLATAEYRNEVRLFGNAVVTGASLSEETPSLNDSQVELFENLSVKAIAEALAEII